MDHDAKSIKPLADFKLQVELVDGRIGIFDMNPYLNLPGLTALRDLDYFKRVQVLFGAVTWPDGEDIAPATLASEMQATVSA